MVQDLLNTAGVPATASGDLLDDGLASHGWLDTALCTWAEQTGQAAPEITVAGSELRALRALRGRVRGWLTGSGDQAAHPLDAAVAWSDGGLTYRPRGSGAAGVASLVQLETLLAVQTGTLARLKLCQNPACGAAFYDLSRNGTRVWHDMKTCGNAINLRASRARRRGAATSEGASPDEPAPAASARGVG